MTWHNVVRGTSSANYSPGNPVRRDQMASFVMRLLEAAGVDAPPPRHQGFTDLGGNVHANRVNQLAQLGVVHGADAIAVAAPEHVVVPGGGHAASVAPSRAGRSYSIT
jgi:hypothetical protein